MNINTSHNSIKKNIAAGVDLQRITEINRSLGIDVEQQLARNLTLFAEELNCVDAGPDYYGRNRLLQSDTLSAWQKMVADAAREGIKLFVCSAFRTYEYQVGLIQRKLDRGQDINDIIKVLAAPGFSEHHTGRAIDIISDEMTELSEAFENTKAFAWLKANADKYNFFLSYPRDNPYGVIYEPWHWCYRQNNL